jgi:hypothetical protein
MNITSTSDLQAMICKGEWSGTTVRQNMERTLWWLVTEVMVKILSDADSRQRYARDGIGEGRKYRFTMKDRAWIQEDTATKNMTEQGSNWRRSKARLQSDRIWEQCSGG